MKLTRPLTTGLAVALIGLVVLVIAVSGGSANPARPQVAPASAISVTQTPLGKTLVDANGRTLYLFQADKPGASTLSAAGLAVWPAFTTTTGAIPAAKGGANATLIGTTSATGGKSQLTYNGHPLYYYVGDQNAGDTRGQGLNQFGALWYVLSDNGSAVTTSAPSSAPAQPAPSSGASSSGY